MGCVSPWAIRLAVRDVRDTGRAAGSLYALSTLGSILGAYLPVLLLIPTIGTKRTFVVFSASLLLVSLAGLAQERRKAIAAAVAAGAPAVSAVSRRSGALLLVYLVALLAIVALAAVPRGVIRAQPYGDLLY